MKFEFNTDNGKRGLADLAAARAGRLGHDRVGTEHLLAVLLGTAFGKLMFMDLGIAPGPLLDRLVRPTADPATGPGFTGSALEAMRICDRETESGSDFMQSLLHGLVEEGEGAVARMLAERDVTFDRVRDAHAAVDDWMAGPWGGNGPVGEVAVDVLDSPLVKDEHRAEILELRRRKEIAIDEQDFDAAAALRDTEKELLAVIADHLREAGSS